MRDRWPQARIAFLRTSALVLLMGVVIAIGGAADGEPAAIPLALGGISLCLVGSFLMVDRLFHALERSERVLLVGAFVISTAIYLALLVIGAGRSGDTLLMIAGIPGLVTGLLTFGLVLERKEAPQDGT